ncbi:hypothetical protein ACQU0X_14550 [Pseudovibrio ascidiaceicola]|uniref:hypothetical protein n=1 Tax=Pseudovibrio ascidiaceicola TaxID=285279 RepID=UPI003D366F77
MTFVVAWIAQNWTSFLEPILQACLIILTVIAAFFMAWNRILDNQLKRKEIRDSGKACSD